MNISQDIEAMGRIGLCRIVDSWTLYEPYQLEFTLP